MKNAIFSFVIMFGVFALRADYLYWMVSDEAYETYGEQSATLYRVASDASDTASKEQVQTLSAEQVGKYYDSSGQAMADIGSYRDGWSYFVELANGVGTDPVTYANLTPYLFTGGTNLPTSLATGGFGQLAGTAYNVPEPTSGLLFLVGGMLLGLRRKRRV